MLHTLQQKVLHNEALTKKEALFLVSENLEALCEAAVAIRKHFCGNQFDLCSIINGKNGNCPEDCKYCAQSIHYSTNIETYPLLITKKIVEAATNNYNAGILRFSIVTSGKRLSNEEVKQVCNRFQAIKKTCNIALCASLGLLSTEQFLMLRDAGVTRYHNNLETSRRFFPSICTTHTYDEKIETIRNAQKAGLAVCSGGIMGLGETMEDRIDMALTLRKLQIQSIPINILNSIPGTPLENNTPLSMDEVRRIVAIYRFLLPNSLLRLAGGRSLMKDKGTSVFRSGANGAITQHMLTTTGIEVHDDKQLIESLGFEVNCYE